MPNKSMDMKHSAAVGFNYTIMGRYLAKNAELCSKQYRITDVMENSATATGLLEVKATFRTASASVGIESWGKDFLASAKIS